MKENKKADTTLKIRLEPINGRNITNPKGKQNSKAAWRIRNWKNRLVFKIEISQGSRCGPDLVPVKMDVQASSTVPNPNGKQRLTWGRVILKLLCPWGTFPIGTDRGAVLEERKNLAFHGPEWHRQGFRMPVRGRWDRELVHSSRSGSEIQRWKVWHQLHTSKTSSERSEMNSDYNPSIQRTDCNWSLLCATLFQELDFSYWLVFCS